MGIYGDKKDYEQLVNENIEKARLLFNLNNEGVKLVEALIEEKERIRNKNGLLANVRINSINKKIEKIREKYKKDSL